MPYVADIYGVCIEVTRDPDGVLLIDIQADEVVEVAVSSPATDDQVEVWRRRALIAEQACMRLREELAAHLVAENRDAGNRIATWDRAVEAGVARALKRRTEGGLDVPAGSETGRRR